MGISSLPATLFAIDGIAGEHHTLGTNAPGGAAVIVIAGKFDLRIGFVYAIMGHQIVDGGRYSVNGCEFSLRQEVFFEMGLGNLAISISCDSEGKAISLRQILPAR